jgi:hypothetical protein
MHAQYPTPTPFEMHSGSEMVKEENKVVAVVGRAEKDNKDKRQMHHEAAMHGSTLLL